MFAPLNGMVFFLDHFVLPVHLHRAPLRQSLALFFLSTPKKVASFHSFFMIRQKVS